MGVDFATTISPNTITYTGTASLPEPIYTQYLVAENDLEIPSFLEEEAEQELAELQLAELQLAELEETFPASEEE